MSTETGLERRAGAGSSERARVGHRERRLDPRTPAQSRRSVPRPPAGMRTRASSSWPRLGPGVLRQGAAVVSTVSPSATIDWRCGVSALPMVAVAALAGGAVLGCGGGSAGGSSRPEAVVQAATLPSPSARGAASRAALAAGRRACRSRRPGVVRDRYLAEARRSRVGASQERFLDTAADPSRAVRGGLAYGQLAARVYALSLPSAERRDGYLGCAFELARSVGTTR